jgi:hypothetical protein
MRYGTMLRKVLKTSAFSAGRFPTSGPFPPQHAARISEFKPQSVRRALPGGIELC